MKKSKKVAGIGGRLVVGILTDEAVMEKKTKPIMPFEERIEIASSIKYIDKVVTQKTYYPFDNLKLIKPDILMESTSHAKESIDALKMFMKKIGGSVIINDYYEKQSSTKIKNIIKKESGHI